MWTSDSLWIHLEAMSLSPEHKHTLTFVDRRPLRMRHQTVPHQRESRLDPGRSPTVRRSPCPTDPPTPAGSAPCSLASGLKTISIILYWSLESINSRDYVAFLIKKLTVLFTKLCQMKHYYRPKRSCGKVIFLHLSVILIHREGGCLPQCMLG